MPATKKLRMGVSEPEVRILRQRLIASGDLDPNAGLSNNFDSYVDGAVKKFQARHGLPPDGILGSLLLPGAECLGRYPSRAARNQSGASALDVGLSR